MERPRKSTKEARERAEAVGGVLVWGAKVGRMDDQGRVFRVEEREWGKGKSREPGWAVGKEKRERRRDSRVVYGRTEGEECEEEGVAVAVAVAVAEAVNRPVPGTGQWAQPVGIRLRHRLSWMEKKVCRIQSD